MDYKNYLPEDFLTNESFLNYCLRKNADDIYFWEQWLKENPEKKDRVEEAKKLFFLIQDDIKFRKEHKAELEEFKSQFREHLKATTPVVRRLPLRNILRYAAVAATVILVIGFWLNVRKSSETVGTIAFKPSTESEVLVRKKVNLPDGSVVTLNANSTIEIPEDYNEKERKIILKGEAFFEVAKNKEKPFIVRSGNISTVALGTSFWVRNYNHEAQVKVLLVTGKVKVEAYKGTVRKPAKTIFLIPNQQAVINLKSHLETKKTVFLPETVEYWKDNVLIFNDTKFEEVLARLEKWYGVKIEVINKPKSTKHFTGEFKNKSLKSVLEALSFSNNFKYSQTDQYVKIEFTN